MLINNYKAEWQLHLHKSSSQLQVPMKSTTSIQRDLLRTEQYIAFYQQEEEEDLLLISELFSDTVIMDRKYQAVSPEEVVKQLDHLNSDEKNKLQSVFANTRESLMAHWDVIPQQKAF